MYTVESWKIIFFKRKEYKKIKKERNIGKEWHNLAGCFFDQTDESQFQQQCHNHGTLLYIHSQADSCKPGILNQLDPTSSFTKHKNLSIHLYAENW